MGSSSGDGRAREGCEWQRVVRVYRTQPGQLAHSSCAAGPTPTLPLAVCDDWAYDMTELKVDLQQALTVPRMCCLFA